MTDDATNTKAGGSPLLSEELGPLPEPQPRPGPDRLCGYSAQQMRAYAAQERAAERERIFGHIRGAMGHAEAGYDDVAWRLLASLVGPNARLSEPQQAEEI